MTYHVTYLDDDGEQVEHPAPTLERAHSVASSLQRQAIPWAIVSGLTLVASWSPAPVISHGSALHA